jgi:hypothetical protein
VPVNVPKPLTFQRPEFVDHAEEDRKQALASFARYDDELSHLGDAAANAAKKIDEFSKNEEALGDIGKVLSEQKAALDLKYEPDETKNKITADEIHLDNADIHVAEAKLNLSEADKRSALANLAPEQAQNAQRDAQNSRDKALSKFLGDRGVDTSALDESNKQFDDINALNDAETALKVANVNRKYAGLQPAEAKLGQEKAATELRSAELEKNDASLKLAKDKDNQPLSHEYAQLKYADASFKAQDALLNLTRDEIKTLGDILQAIVKLDLGRDDNRIGKLSAPSGGNGGVDYSGTSNGVGRQSSGNGTIPTSYTDSSGQRIEQGPGVGPDQQQRVVRRQQSDDGSGSSGIESIGDSGSDRNLPDQIRRYISGQDQNKPDRHGHYDASGAFVPDNYAGGGYVTGPGTSTSDSINAHLSDKEFVHNAKAVEYYGVDKMHALNRMEIPKFGDGGLFTNLGHVVNNMTPLPKFSLANIGAGIVARMNSVAVPRLAGMSPGVTLAHFVSSVSSVGTDAAPGSGERHLIDLRTDHGIVPNLRANDDTLGKLRQQALMKANVRTGKSQSWDR